MKPLSTDLTESLISVVYFRQRQIDWQKIRAGRILSVMMSDVINGYFLFLGDVSVGADNCDLWIVKVTTRGWGWGCVVGWSERFFYIYIWRFVFTFLLFLVTVVLSSDEKPSSDTLFRAPSLKMKCKNEAAAAASCAPEPELRHKIAQLIPKHIPKKSLITLYSFVW